MCSNNVAKARVKKLEAEMKKVKAAAQKAAAKKSKVKKKCCEEALISRPSWAQASYALQPD